MDLFYLGQLSAGNLHCRFSADPVQIFLSFHTHHHVFRFVLNFVTKCLPPRKNREGEHFKGEFYYTILLHTSFMTEGRYCGLPLSERPAPCKDKLPYIGDKIVCGQYFQSIPHNLHYVVEADRDCLMQNVLKICFIHWLYCENIPFADSVSDSAQFFAKKVELYHWHTNLFLVYMDCGEKLWYFWTMFPGKETYHYV